MSIDKRLAMLTKRVKENRDRLAITELAITLMEKLYEVAPKELDFILGKWEG